MNLQFSLNTSTANNKVSTGRQYSDNNAAYQVNSQLLNTVKSGSELTKLETQGISIPIGEEQLIRNIDRAVKALQGPSTSLEISIHERTHSVMVKVMNKETGELIREIPPEKTLDLVAKMMEIAGILIDQRV
ncbi:flagellar biosynthesis protein FlaG [Paenibacillus odorifer]|uniref:Flagellar biosynthesis protein FlaG n=1 Tax=Paenibacillus odorifer TaxID=189426 RepID=A0A1R0WW33_9BACL|nr:MULTISPECIES: flagellar protein FlaG [Paenibacillus]ETT65509.1 flagellar protein flag protein [Paenibacillus sp. FSL H8-237]OMD22467.1 flagellar biosynthesis protein FlaG [Paenibacillus odorifer]OME44822.1 flagellar biosynthesis protein FlaG [Paenibacillus odorifer]OME59205.1 flagellar biosynthesis protein FlaG [Paenibacillus odorifer]